ncbi:carboxy terminal-processing peptidase [soil metagenome]
MNFFSVLIRPFFSLICVLALPFQSVDSLGQNVCEKAKVLIELINHNHLEPRIIDDVLSERVFAILFNSLDPDQFYFTKIDSGRLSTYRLAIDNNITDGSCSFLAPIAMVYKEKIIHYKTFCDSALKKPLNYNVDDRSNPPFLAETIRAADYASRSKKFIRDLKYKILNRAWRMAQANNDLLTIANFYSYEKLARDKIRSRINRLMDNVINPPEGFEKSIENKFLKAISLSFDPHTEFFTPAEMKEFDLSLSTSGLSFGFDLKETQTGEIQIRRLTPGGPAWRSEEINEGDVLISLKFENEPLMDVLDFESEEIVGRLMEMKSLHVDITIKKPDGMLRSVTLRKEKTENLDNLIASFVLEDTKKIGYIALPGFYTSENEQSGKGCAGDVAKEVIKLKKDGIEGLILDLRFNGGGSIQEALDLAGIFIDSGPLAIMEQKGNLLLTLKDNNKGNVFSGSLVIMTNAFSASASELVAAALQDYNRAIILGTSSYGKATGQIVLHVTNDASNWGFAKITSDRIYRISGNSLQMNGVVPDITFPEITDIFNEKEEYLAFALLPKKVTKKLYYTVDTPPPIARLRTASRKRTSTSDFFKSVETLESVLRTPVPLEVESFLVYMKTFNAAIKAMADSRVLRSNYKVYSSNAEASLLIVDDFHREINENALAEIQKSPYIFEAYNILIDQLTPSKP